MKGAKPSDTKKIGRLQAQAEKLFKKYTKQKSGLPMQTYDCPAL